MKKLILFLLAIVLPFAFSSCKEETPTEEEVLLEGIKCLDKEIIVDKQINIMENSRKETNSFNSIFDPDDFK